MRAETVGCGRSRETSVDSMPPIILYFEDDVEVQRIVRTALEGRDWQVDACGDLPTALEKIASNLAYSLVIFNYDINGRELLRRIRALEFRRKIPLLVYGASDCERKARAAGVDAFFQKPFEANNLTITISWLFSRG